MKNILLAAAAALVATPAVAADNDAFVGPRIGVTAGAVDVTRSTDNFTYGVDAGVDFPIGDEFTLGFEAFSNNVFDDDRIIGAAARLGYAVEDSVLLYGRAGYSNYKDVFNRKLDGLSVGGGLEFSANDGVYIKTEYRYTDFEQNTGSHTALVGLGLRF